MITVVIDFNVRVRGNQTFAGFEDADRVPDVGEQVRVLEVETGASGPGEVVDVDHLRRLIYIAVEWSALSL